MLGVGKVPCLRQVMDPGTSRCCWYICGHKYVQRAVSTSGGHFKVHFIIASLTYIMLMRSSQEQCLCWAALYLQSGE